MAKYLKYEQKGKKRPVEMNPIWRGIGCLLIILVPAMSFGLMLVFVPPIVATGLIPGELLGYVLFPPNFYGLPVLGPVVSFISSLKDLWINLIGFFVFLILLSGLFSVLYSIVYQYVGPPRYTAQDAPPTSRRGRSYRR